MVDGERKAWELRTCMKKYGGLQAGIEANLEFFIGLRNKIEHRGVLKGLTYLGLSGTRVTGEGVADLKSVIPNVKVDFK